jgi:hypothetical protein
MKDRFPRTPAEFKTHDRAVVMRCPNGHSAWIKPQSLIQRLGPDFDIYDGFAELQRAFDCDVCGAPQEASIRRPETKGPLGFEEALVSRLEFNAFVEARDALRDPGMRARQGSGGRRRRFGRR